jgi:hypothetical protein
VRRVQIWGDHDAAGQDAAAEAAKRLRAEGREVRILLPPKAGMDWLDVLNEHGPEALQAALRDAKAVSAEKISDWPPVIPFREFNLPPFPLDALPEWVRDFVRAEAVTTQTPPDMAALLALSTLAVISARLVEVNVKTDYREPVNLFTVVILPPANRKSRVFTDVTCPVSDWEKNEALRMAPEIADAEHHRKMVEALVQKATKEAVRAEGGEREIHQQEASLLARELAEMRGLRPCGSSPTT